MTTWQLYLITRLDNLNSFFCFCLIFCFFILSILFFIFIIKAKDDDFNDENEKDNFCKSMAKYFSITLIMTFIFTIIAILIPSEKDVLNIYAGEWITNSKEMKEIPDNTVKAINKLLELYINKDTNK